MINAPSNVVVTIAPWNQKNRLVTVTWQDNSDNEDGFALQVKLKRNEDWTLGNLNGPNHTEFEMGLPAGTTWPARIVAFIGPGFGPYDEVAYSDEFVIDVPPGPLN